MKAGRKDVRAHALPSLAPPTDFTFHIWLGHQSNHKCRRAAMRESMSVSSLAAAFSSSSARAAATWSPPLIGQRGRRYMSFFSLLGSSSSRSTRVHKAMMNDMDIDGATHNSTTIGLSRTCTHACTLLPSCSRSCSCFFFVFFSKT